MQCSATVFVAVISIVQLFDHATSTRIGRVGSARHSSDAQHTDVIRNANGEGDEGLAVLPSPLATPNAEGEREGEEAVVIPPRAPQYAFSSFNSSVCDQGSQPITDASSCRAAAKALGFPYATSGSWPAHPHGCQQLLNEFDGQPLYFNRNVGSADPNFRVICKVPEFVVSSWDNNTCPQGYKPIDDVFSCRDAAEVLGLRFRIASSWASDPHGCHKRTLGSRNDDMSAWYNSHTGSANPDYTLICTRASSYHYLHEYDTDIACDDSGRIPDIWLWGCTGTCGPYWGDLAKCKALCDHIGDDCTHITYFSNGACGIFSECTATIRPAADDAYIYSKVKPIRLEVKYFGFGTSDRVRVVMDVNGHAHHRWQQLPRMPVSEEGEHSVELSEDEFGTVSSISRGNHFEVGVIFDKSVNKETWVDPDYLIKDDFPLKEAANDTLIEDVLRNFPRAEDMAIFKCPITEQNMTVPVVACDGRTYEKSALEAASNGSEGVFENFVISSLLKTLSEKENRASTEELENQTGKSPLALGPENVASFKCPLSLEFFRDPVVASDGHTYERESIQRVLNANSVSPYTREPLSFNLSPNRAMKSLLSAMVQEADRMQLTISLNRIFAGGASPTLTISEPADEAATGFCHAREGEGDGEHSTFVDGGISSYTRSHCKNHCNAIARVQHPGIQYCCIMSQWGSRVVCTLKYGNLDVEYDGVSVWRVDPPDANDGC